jgi:hypothetical protein
MFKDMGNDGGTKFMPDDLSPRASDLWVEIY